MPARVRQFKRLLRDAALLPTLVLAGFAGVLLWQVLYLQELNDREKLADAVQSRVGQLERLYVDGDAGLRGYLLSGDEALLAPFTEAQRDLAAVLGQLQSMLQGDPTQLARAEALGRLEVRYHDYSTQALAERRTGRGAAAALRVQEGEAILDAIRGLVREVVEDVESKRSSRNLDSREMTQRTVVFGGVLALVLMSVVALSAIRQMRRAADLFGGAVRARDEFISVASHELKTPLTSLQLQVQILSRQLGRGAEEAGEGPQRRLAMIEQSTRRLGDLVNRLLDVSRLNSGHLELSCEPLDLAELARDSVGRLRERIEARGVTVTVEATPVTGEWDRLRLESVVTNLLDNALKYGEGKPVVVRVEPQGEAAVLTVQDQGPGIAAGDQERIFERFQRAVGDRVFEGLGVGLWLVRAIAEAHGGTIRLASEPGRGAAFTVRLPRARDGQEARRAAG